MSVPPIGRATILALGAALFVALLIASTVPVPPASESGPAMQVTAMMGSCPSAPVGTAYAGNLTIYGGPLPTNASAGVVLGYNYSLTLEVTNRTTGTLLTTSCVIDTGSVTTGSNGSFGLNLTVPAVHCYGSLCTRSFGPYGPLEIGPQSGPPAGYSAVSTVVGSNVSVELVAELGGLTLTPSAELRTLSPNAPGPFVAHPLTALGGPSPIDPTFLWNLTGTGWSMNGSGSNRTVEALPGAGPGALSVVATAANGSNTFSVGPVRVALAAVATNLTGANANRTALDAGGSVAFSIEGTGAPGYGYVADVTPGLGLDEVAWNCTTTPLTQESVTVVCRGVVAYPAAGQADPSVELTNSYSVAEGGLPAVLIAPRPAIAVAPAAPVGYAGESLPIGVTVAPGTGTPPYVLACVDPSPSGTPVCETTPGPNWSFGPIYPSAGNYTGKAWVVDSDGTNISVPFTSHVVAPLVVSPIVAPSNVSADEAVNLSAGVAGGLLPIEFWWNASHTNGSIFSGRAFGDGALTATWVPTVRGSTEITFVARDDLGSQVEASYVLMVGAPAATRLASVAAPTSGPVVAGTSTRLAWQAVDLQNGSVDTYDPSVTLEVTVAGRPATGFYANSSSGVPYSAVGTGAYQVPSSAWSGGQLTVVVGATVTGVYTVRLMGSGLPNGTAPVEFAVTADLGHLHAFDPEVALAGSRDNRTFWFIADEFGNPAPAARITFVYNSSQGETQSNVPVELLAGNRTGVWYNFSAPTAGGGQRWMSDAAGTVLLPALDVPAVAAPVFVLTGSTLTVAAAVPVGAVGIGVTAWASRRRRVGVAESDPPTDEELLQLVTGRDRVIGLVRDARALDMAGLTAAWGESPVPAELPDWVASLVADGTLGARIGPDGVARFYLAAGAEGPPIVLVDPNALAHVDAARKALTEDSDATGDR